jgi:hypothetical protein
MDELLNYLEKYDPKPQYAQVASGGVWEKGVRVDFNSSTEIPLLEDSLDSTVAVEFFYRLNDNRLIFLGLRYSSMLTSISNPEEFLAELSEVIKVATTLSPRQLLKELGEHLNNEPNTYISPNIDYGELGVEGYWKSVGHQILRKRGELRVTEEALHTPLEQNQMLLRNSKNHTALEFAVGQPEYWVAVQTSTRKDGEYITDLNALVQLLNMI